MGSVQFDHSDSDGLSVTYNTQMPSGRGEKRHPSFWLVELKWEPFPIKGEKGEIHTGQLDIGQEAKNTFEVGKTAATSQAALDRYHASSRNVMPQSTRSRGNSRAGRRFARCVELGFCRRRLKNVCTQVTSEVNFHPDLGSVQL